MLVLAVRLALLLTLGATACSSKKSPEPAAPASNTKSLGDEPEVAWSKLGPADWPRHEGNMIRVKGYVFVSLSICGKKKCEGGACPNACNACSEYLAIAREKIPDEPRSDSWDKVPSLGLAGTDPADFSCGKPADSCERTCPLVVGGKYEILGRFHDGIMYGVTYRAIREDE